MNLNTQHFNACAVRVRQGQNRAKKGGYSPRFIRATHDDPSAGKKKEGN